MTWQEFFENANITDPGVMSRMQSQYPNGPGDMPPGEFERQFPGLDPGGGKVGPDIPGQPSEIPGQTTSGGGESGFEDPGGAGWFLDWLGSESEKWLEYSSGLKEQLEAHASGVDVATESALARQAEVSEQRALAGLSENNAYFGGMRAPIVGAIQQGAAQGLAESRSRVQATGEKGLLALSDTYAGLLGRGYGSGASVYGSIYGQPPYGGQWRSDTPGEQAEYGTGTTTGQPVPGQPIPKLPEAKAA